MIKIAIGAYGVLSIVAALAQTKVKNIPKLSGLLMLIGGILMIVSLFVNPSIGIFVLVTGLLTVHASAVINGIKMYGKVNKSHHIARFVISIVLALLYFLEFYS